MIKIVKQSIINYNHITTENEAIDYIMSNILIIQIVIFQMLLNMIL